MLIITDLFSEMPDAIHIVFLLSNVFGKYCFLIHTVTTWNVIISARLSAYFISLYSFRPW